MNPITKLAELFTQFPGIGPRQAKRFVHFLAAQDSRYLDELSHTISTLTQSVAHCRHCIRLFTPRSAEVSSCDICTDRNREHTALLIVAKDADVDAIEQAGTYNGVYFVLGGTVSALEEDPAQRIRIRELERRIANGGISEIILALPANPDGDATALYLTQMLENSADAFTCTISKLGRGLSTGLELEYSDPETIRNAFANRS